MMLNLHFATQTNFLDPQLTSDGRPYGPVRYKEIVRELYIISKNCSTPYTELMNITPREREYLKEFITEESEKMKEQIEKNKQEIMNR